MDVGEFRPGNWNHFSGRVKLHRAGAKWNHAAVEGEVAIGKPPQIAQHFRFRAVEMEDRVSQEVAATGKLRGDRIVRLHTQLFERWSGDLSFGLRSECSPYCLDHGRRGGFIATDADAGLRAGANFAEVDRVRCGIFENFGLTRTHLDCDGVEERSLLNLPTERRQSVDQRPGGAMDLVRNVPETVRAVIDRI